MYSSCSWLFLLLPLLLPLLLRSQQLLCSAKSIPKRELRGAGASFPNEVYQSWMVAYGAARTPHVDLTLSYEAVGSGSGKKRIEGLTGEPVDYAGSDSWLSEQDYEDYPDLKAFPTMAGAVTLAYNLPEASDDRLIVTMDHIVGIYNGTYRFWNDSVFQELNPHLELPNEPILVLARADKSGTTDIFTGSLTHASSAWASTYGTFSHRLTGEQSSWEPGVITYFAHQNRGMSGLLLSFKYSVGYLSISDAVASDVQYAKLVNQDGTLVTPNISAVQALMEASLEATGGHLVVHLTAHGNLNSYPIADYTYLIVRMHTMGDCDTAIELLRYIDWFLSDPAAKDACITKYMVPVTESMASAIRKEVIEKLTCNDELVWPLAHKEIISEQLRENETYLRYVMVACALVGGILMVVSGYFLHKYIQYNRLLMRDEWSIHVEDITFCHTEVSSKTGKTKLVMWPSVTSLTDVEDLDEGYDMLKHILHWPGKWGNLTIGLRLLEVKSARNIDRNTKLLLLWMKDVVNHSNVLKFHGLTQVETNHYVVSNYCSRGSLQDLLHDAKYNLNNDFKMALSLDIASGLSYLHSKNVVHGNLRASCCLLDFKWMIKIGDWEYIKLYEHLFKKKNPLLLLRKNEDELGKDAVAFLDYWTAPEILKSDFEQWPSPCSDVFSYGIVLQEIFTRRDPYAEHSEESLPRDLIKNIVNNHLRPQHDPDTPGNVRHLMECTWYEDPEKRPTSDQILKRLRNGHDFKKTIIDSVMETTEEYTKDLESKLELSRLTADNLQERLKRVQQSLVPSQLFDPPQTTHLEREEDKVHLENDGADVVKQCTTNSAFHWLPTKHQEINKSVTVVCIKYVAPGTYHHTFPRAYWEAFNKLDLQIDQIVLRHRVFRSDNAQGMVILIRGLNQENKKHPASSFAADLFKLCSHFQQHRTNGGRSCGTQLGIHKGLVHTYVVQNNLPKCYFLGETIDIVQALADQSEPGRILASKAFMESINRDDFVLDACDKNPRRNGTTETAYWLSRAPKKQTLSSPTKNQHVGCSSDVATGSALPIFV